MNELENLYNRIGGSDTIFAEYIRSELDFNTQQGAINIFLAEQREKINLVQQIIEIELRSLNRFDEIETRFNSGITLSQEEIQGLLTELENELLIIRSSHILVNTTRFNDYETRYNNIVNTN